ncbi:hypothetical protein [Paraburkholderia sp. BCC1884]|uniref:hypothetical protein n=1 Tax=Paraburkholderia sp. BCC1884 TaxID=2562668 RepID=UPI0011826182|nr:hypothetical protein [Paraburkholderia sp. BCC1884]
MMTPNVANGNGGDLSLDWIFQKAKQALADKGQEVKDSTPATQPNGQAAGVQGGAANQGGTGDQGGTAALTLQKQVSEYTTMLTGFSSMMQSAGDTFKDVARNTK